MSSHLSSAVDWLGFAAARTLPVLGFALLASLVGWRLLRRLPGVRTEERLVLGAIAGQGLLATQAFALGLLGRFDWPVLLCLLAVEAVSLRTRNPGPRLLRQTWLPLAAVAIALLPALCFALYPSIGFDANVYHLPQARAFADSHAVAFLPSLRFPVFPQLNEMLFALGMLLADETTAVLWELLLLALSAGLVFVWSRTLASRSAAWLVTALCLGHPLLHWLGSAAYVDVGVALFAAAAGYSFFRSQRQPSPEAWLLASGAFAGFAAATKYSGLYFAATLACALLWQRRRALPLLAFALGVVLTAGPWYARTTALTGNPLFPFLPGVFGQSEWSRERSPVGQIDSGVPSNLEIWLAGGGGPHPFRDESWRAFTLPFQLAANRLNPNRVAPLSPIAALLLPVALVAGLRTRRLRSLTAIGAGYLAFWFVTCRDLRYLTPLLLLSCVALAPTAGALARQTRRRWPSQATALGVLACLIALAPGPLYIAYRIDLAGPLPLTPAARDAYRSRYLPGHDALVCLRSLAGPEPHVYGLFAEHLAFDGGAHFCGDWFGPCRFADVIDRLGDPARLHDFLRERGSDFLLCVVPAGGAACVAPAPTFQPVYSCGTSQAFRLADAAAPAVAEAPVPCRCPAPP